jgi:hypothetical protein
LLTANATDYGHDTSANGLEHALYTTDDGTHVVRIECIAGKEFLMEM